MCTKRESNSSFSTEGESSGVIISVPGRLFLSEVDVHDGSNGLCEASFVLFGYCMNLMVSSNILTPVPQLLRAMLSFSGRTWFSDTFTHVKAARDKRALQAISV